jgi:hypothetical protein
MVVRLQSTRSAPSAQGFPFGDCAVRFDVGGQAARSQSMIRVASWSQAAPASAIRFRETATASSPGSCPEEVRAT